MNKIINLLLILWQLPQMLLGWLLLLIYTKEKSYYKLNGRTFYYTTEMSSGISLGNIIILNKINYGVSMKHEYGHSIQSRILGPLYLIVIGLPSLFGNIYDKIAHKHWSKKESVKWYYNQPWEKWADKLGHVNRNYDIYK